MSGLVGVFATLGERGDVADPSLIASGIAVALNTTIAGLVVAVITVIFHSYFTRRLERIAARIEVIAGHLLHEFYRAGGVALYEQESQSSAELDGILRGRFHRSRNGGLRAAHYGDPTVNFYRKRRQRPAVPIITLIDILAILLIFFIVTTTFKTRESLLKVNLRPRQKCLVVRIPVVVSFCC